MTPTNHDIDARAAGIRLILFDVDGVLTDGRVLVHSDGTESKSFAIRDGIARSRAADPTAGGFGPIFALGPSGLVADEQARRHYFGEDLEQLPSIPSSPGNS